MNNRDRLAAPRESFSLSISNNGDRLAAPRRDRRSEGYFASMLMIARSNLASYDDVCAIAFALTHAAAFASRNSTFEIRLINPRRACARVTVVVCLCSTAHMTSLLLHASMHLHNSSCVLCLLCSTSDK